MRYTVLCFCLIVILVGCDKDQSKIEDSSKLNPQEIAKTKPKFVQADRDRIEEILNSLRNPEFKFAKDGINSGRGLGGIVIDSDILKISYTEEEIEKFGKALGDKLSKIYLSTKYSQVQKEIVNLYKIIGVEYAKEKLVKICKYPSISLRSLERTIDILGKILEDHCDDKTLMALTPLLKHENEDIRCRCAILFGGVNAKSVLPILLTRFKDNKETTKVRLHLISSVCRIDGNYRDMCIEFANDVIINPKERNNICLASEIASDLKDVSTLEIMLKFFEADMYEDSFLKTFIYPLANYKNDKRVEKLFFEIVQNNKYGKDVKILVLNRYSWKNDKSIELIKKLIEQSIADGWGKVSIALSGISALGRIGDEDTITYLEELKDKYEDHSKEIEFAIEMIRSDNE